MSQKRDGEIPLLWKIFYKESAMGTKNEIIRKKRAGNLLRYGLLTAVLYAAVFTNQSTVMLYFTKVAH